MLPRLLRAMEHSNSAVINRDGGRLGHWSYVATFAAHDSQFANYLGDASSAVAVTGYPAGKQYARKAAVDLGHINGYCKYDVGVIMGY